MIVKEFNGKQINLNCLSFRALEDLEKVNNCSIYDFISKSIKLSVTDITNSLTVFARHGATPLTQDDLQLTINSKGLNYLSEVVQECIINILNGQPEPKASTSKVKKK
jgi:hypothetical protein